MVIPFSPDVTLPTPEDQAQRAAHTAMCAIGDLTRLATETDDSEFAFRMHGIANDVYRAALGAVGAAIDRTDAIVRERP